MDNPQVENGHTDIANELMEQFAKLHLSGNEWMLLMVVLRKTWGWHKKEDSISLSQFQKSTGLSRPAVSKSLSKLVAKSVLVANKQNFIVVYSVNKHYSDWTSSKIATSSISRTMVAKSVLVAKKSQLVAKQLPKLVAKQLPTKENKEITKENRYMEISSITENDFMEISQKYQVPVSFVRSKYDDMEIWAGSMPDNKKIKGRNWRLTLMGFVKRDSIQLRKEASQHESKRGIDARGIV